MRTPAFAQTPARFAAPLAAAFLVAATTAAACPFCAAPSLTLSEQVNQADVAVVAEWAAAQEADADNAASTTFRVVRPLKGGESLDQSEPVKTVVYRAGEPGDLFLLLASFEDDAKADDAAGDDASGDEAAEAEGGDAADGDSEGQAAGAAPRPLRWSGPVEITAAVAEYLDAAPAVDAPEQERLAYYLKFLEDADETVATDAYSEFAGAPYDAVVPLAEQMDTAKLRRWLTDEDVTPTRLGLYGMMLGLSGDESDAAAMLEIINTPTDEFRLGIDGIMGGYILLTGEEGLSEIEQSKLLARDIPFNETYAAMQALRFLWKYAEGTVPKERLRQSMRLLLQRPDMADLVIADLARWKDWSLVDSLDGLYDAEGFEMPAIKRAIIRYYLTATKTKKDAPSDEVKAAAEEKLEALKEADPKTYESAVRFFFIGSADFDGGPRRGPPRC